MENNTPKQADLLLAIELARKGCPTFYIVFTLVYPRFDKRLRSLSLGLRPDDLAVCAYTKLGFRTQQIADFTKNSTRAVECRKYRIRKKLEIPKGVSFCEFMVNL